MSLPSYAGDSAAEMTWLWHYVDVEVISPWCDVDVESCWQWRYRDDLAAARYRCQVMLVTILLSHAAHSPTEVT
jgi:hypothetical protein